jgi:hypothetical protein
VVARNGRWLLGAALLGAAVSCTSNTAAQPKPADFTPGTCQAAAAAVLDIGGQVHRLHHGAAPAAVEATLARDQATLRRLPASADPSIRNGVDDLAVAVGYFRLLLDSNEYTPQRLTEVDHAQRALVHNCVAGRSAARS